MRIRLSLFSAASGAFVRTGFPFEREQPGLKRFFRGDRWAVRAEQAQVVGCRLSATLPARMLFWCSVSEGAPPNGSVPPPD